MNGRSSGFYHSTGIFETFSYRNPSSVFFANRFRSADWQKIQLPLGGSQETHHRWLFVNYLVRTVYYKNQKPFPFGLFPQLSTACEGKSPHRWRMWITAIRQEFNTRMPESQRSATAEKGKTKRFSAQAAWFFAIIKRNTTKLQQTETFWASAFFICEHRCLFIIHRKACGKPCG